MAQGRQHPSHHVAHPHGGGSLLDLVDNLLNQGVVLTGELTLSLANVDLVYARLSVVLCAADMLMPLGRKAARARRARKEAGRLAGRK